MGKLQVKSARAESGDETGGEKKKKERRKKKNTERKKNQLISIKTDCQTRWGLFKNWGRVGGEGL